MKNLSFEDENLKKYDFPWTFFLELFFGENQDPKEEFKQKTTLLQNCSRLVIFLAVLWCNTTFIQKIKTNTFDKSNKFLHWFFKVVSDGFKSF